MGLKFWGAGGTNGRPLPTSPTALFDSAGMGITAKMRVANEGRHGYITDMNIHLENFQSWFVRVLESLYLRDDAGFAVTMMAFPLLERYLRQKVGLTPEQNLSEGFYTELRGIFPELHTQAIARTFWQVYRNGILHQVAFSSQTRSRQPLPAGAFSSDLRDITISPSGEFFLNPEDFARRVTQQIENDFATFEGAGSSAPPLAVESSVPLSRVMAPDRAAAAMASHPTGYVLGTSAAPSDSQGNTPVGAITVTLS
jgi:hypothetical protein